MTLVRAFKPSTDPATPPLPGPWEPSGDREAGGWDIVDDWGVASFPASDPPSNW